MAEYAHLGTTEHQTMVLLRRADRDLLKRCRGFVEASLAESQSAEVREALTELLADIAEELGAKVVEDKPAEPAKRTITTADGKVHQVR